MADFITPNKQQQNESTDIEGVHQEQALPSGEQEALLRLDSAYLHIQQTDEGYDYSIYGMDLRLIDGGVIENTELTIDDAFYAALEAHDLDSGNTEIMPMSKLEEIERVADAAIQDALQKKGIEANTDLPNPQPFPPIDREALLADGGDVLAIYQVKDGPEYRDFRFQSLENLQDSGLAVDSTNYGLTYVSPLGLTGFSTSEKLEAIYNDFNFNRPKDFEGRSVSMSDVIMLRVNGETTYHYTEPVGFKDVPDFMQDTNPLRIVEEAMEQNANHIDGIINNLPTPTRAELEAEVKAGKTISLMDMVRALKEEPKEKSVLARLREQQSPKEPQKTDKTPDKSAGKER